MNEPQLGLGRGEIGWDALCILGFLALFVVATIAVILALVLRRKRKD
jgi:hypothetical protein